MKLLAKPSRLVLRLILIAALAGSLPQLMLQPPAGVALSVPDRAGMLQTLRARSAALAPADAYGIVFSGATSPGDLLTSYLAAAGFMKCAPVCALTVKGRARRWPAQSLIADLAQMTVPLADVKVNAITQIRRHVRNAADGEASVDFSYRAQPNALGRAMLAWAGSRRFCGVDYVARWHDTQRGTATFATFHDRWRLTAATPASTGSNPFGIACAMP